MSFTLTRGRVPLLISFPHSGTGLPDALAAELTPAAGALPDTDWLVPELYDMVSHLGAWTLRAHMSRYVVDLNRDPDGHSLYPGQSTTSLCPVDTFNSEPIYATAPPDDAQIQARRARYFLPYHSALANALDTLVANHGGAVLWDAHSIRSQVPRFFEGTLPALNLGTAHGTSCAPAVREAVVGALRTTPYQHVVDGRFVGGYITRHYGRPQRNVHALQMEIAQSAYMHESGQPRLKPQAQRALSAALERALQAALEALPAPADKK